MKRALLIQLLVFWAAAFWSGGSAMAQIPEVCTIDGDSITIRIAREWSPEERAKHLDPFGLDTVFVKQALTLSKADTLSDAEGFVWQVHLEGNVRVKLRRAMQQESKGLRPGDHLLNPDVGPQEFFAGPGYVNEHEVVYGRNKFKGPEPVQNDDGAVTFVLNHFKDAKEIIISGSFNNWRTSEHYMERNAQGVWELTLPLQPGKYLYKFIVDGYWKHDPQNELKEQDGWNGHNSVLYIYNHRFYLPGRQKAKKVTLTGSFNGWNLKELPMERGADGWFTHLYLKDGSHAYKFLVDGKYHADPLNDDKRPDGFGGFNSFLSLGKAYRFYLPGFENGEKVVLSGTFNNWNEEELPMTKTKSGWELYYAVPEGNYEYKFIVDGAWHEDVFNPYLIYHGDYKNSFVAIGTNHIFSTDEFPDAEEVIITGNFTGWSEENNRMIRRDGKWVFPMYLTPGKYTYRFKADGVWSTDPENPLKEDNGLGEFNSVIWFFPGH